MCGYYDDNDRLPEEFYTRKVTITLDEVQARWLEYVADETGTDFEEYVNDLFHRMYDNLGCEQDYGDME